MCVCWDCEGVVYGGNRLLVIKEDEKKDDVEKLKQRYIRRGLEPYQF